jgi:subtilisin family serine protease
MQTRGIRAAFLPAVLVAVAAAACHPTPPPPPPPPPPPAPAPSNPCSTSQAASTPTTSQSAPTPTPQSPVKYSAVIQSPGAAPTAATFTATSPSDKDAKVQQLQRYGPVTAVAPDKKVSALADTVKPNGNPDYLNGDQWGLASADFPAAWTSGFGGTNIRIAIIDTGLRLSHQDFAPMGSKAVAGPDYVTDPSGNTLISTSLPNNGDPNGHGTHTAGIAAADDNGVGGLGGAPDATLIPVRVLDANGSGFTSDVANGITWAANPAQGHARVISLSLGGSTPTSDVQAAVEYANQKGVVVVAAAGNASSPCPNAEYPGAFSTDPNAAVIAVAATDVNGNLASYSNFGSFVTIAAPGGTGSSVGTSIFSTYNQSDTSYALLDGTSMATPFVAAAAGLLQEKCGVSAAQVRADLVNHHGPAVPGQSFNRVDAGALTC